MPSIENTYLQKIYTGDISSCPTKDTAVMKSAGESKYNGTHCNGKTKKI